MTLVGLTEAIAAICPIYGVSSARVISFKAEATPEQRAAAQSMADSAVLVPYSQPVPPASPASPGVPVFSLEDFGVKADLTDETERINFALNQIPSGAVIDLGLRTYIAAWLEISKPVTFRGRGKYQTILRTPSSTQNLINITTGSACTFEDMTIGALVPRTAGSFVAVNPPQGGINTDSVFRRINFQSPYIALDFIRAQDFTVDDCYFAGYIVDGMRVGNLTTPDAGDSTVTNNTFDGSGHSGVGIHQTSSGGLRVNNNKFLAGAYHYLAEFNTSPNNTSILVFNDNSTENASVANVALMAQNGTTFGWAMVNDNQLSVGQNACGILIGDPGYDFLDGAVLGGNIFNQAAGSAGMSIGRGKRVSILPNNFAANGAGCTGIGFGPNVAHVDCHRQDMSGMATKFAGSLANVHF